MEEDLSYQVELIERVKKELGMSQSDIARTFEVGTSVVSKWSNGKTPITVATKIALELMIERKKDEKIIDWVKDITNIIELVKQKMDKLLLDESPLIILPSLASAIGLNEPSKAQFDPSPIYNENQRDY